MVYKCQICGYETNSASGFSIHLKKSHNLTIDHYNSKYEINILSKEFVFQKIYSRNKNINNYIILTDNITSLKQKIKLYCKLCGHYWETSIPVLYRSNCPSCQNQIKPNINEFKEKLLKKHNGRFVCLSDEYVNNKTHLLFKCTICDYEFKYLPIKILQPNMKCKNCKKHNLQNNIDYIAKIKKLKIISYPTNYSSDSKITICCENCNSQWETTIFSFVNNNGCKFCNKYISRAEIEISEWLTSIGVHHERNKRLIYNNKNHEIDIFIPEYKLAIDFHGLYWHSDAYKDKNYHINKFNFVKKLGYQYIQIWENEWIFKKDIVKSIILNKIDKCHQIFARKCEIREIDTSTAKVFFEKNHIQGFVGGKIKLGLFYNNQLVSAIIIGANRYNKGFEIIRFANKLNTNVVGGFSKFIQYIKRNMQYIDVLDSFVDLRYFNGNGYLKAGFVNLGQTAPSHYYFKNNQINKLYHRSVFMKHKLPKLLNVFDANLTEAENMRNNGYLKIYDCGTLKMRLYIQN